MSDETKPRMALIPTAGLSRVARVLERGLQDGKREPGDWRRRDPVAFRDALFRHLAAYLEGRAGEDHIAAVAANALILLALEERPTFAVDPGGAPDEENEG